MIKLTEIWSREELEERKSFGAREVTCPICGNETLDDWSICPHCDWEYDYSVGYSDANRSYKWWYKLKYKFKMIFNPKRGK